MVVSAARQIFAPIKDPLDKKPTNTTRNTIYFLNKLSEEELRTMGVNIGL